VILADCFDLVLLGARVALEQAPDFQLVAVATDAPALLRLAQQRPCDVIVFDVGLGLDHDLWDLITQLRACAGPVKLIVMCSSRSGHLTHELLSQGVDGVLCKYDELQTCLLSAIRSVVSQRTYLSPIATSAYLVAQRDAEALRLIDRQARLLLRLLTQGSPPGEIAGKMRLSRPQVYKLREQTRAVFGAATNEQLIYLALAEGYIFP
jgi:DNA-binding NarL/FixJ family response regulator